MAPDPDNKEEKITYPNQKTKTWLHISSPLYPYDLSLWGKKYGTSFSTKKVLLDSAGGSYKRLYEESGREVILEDEKVYIRWSRRGMTGTTS